MGTNPALWQGRELPQSAARAVQRLQTSCLLLTVTYLPAGDMRGTCCACPPADSWVPPLVTLMPAHPPQPWEPGFHKVPRDSYLSHVWEVFTQQAAGIQMKQVVQGHPLQLPVPSVWVPCPSPTAPYPPSSRTRPVAGTQYFCHVCAEHLPCVKLGPTCQKREGIEGQQENGGGNRYS